MGDDRLFLRQKFGFGSGHEPIDQFLLPNRLFCAKFSLKQTKLTTNLRKISNDDKNTNGQIKLCLKIHIKISNLIKLRRLMLKKLKRKIKGILSKRPQFTK